MVHHFFVQKAVAFRTGQTHRHPQKGVGQANLAQKIEGRVPVIPNRVLAVDQKSRRQLHGGDDPGPGHGFYPGRLVFQPAQQEKAGAAGKEHGAVGPTSPQKLQPRIPQPSGAEEQGCFPVFHIDHPI